MEHQLMITLVVNYLNRSQALNKCVISNTALQSKWCTCVTLITPRTQSPLQCNFIMTFRKLFFLVVTFVLKVKFDKISKQVSKSYVTLNPFVWQKKSAFSQQLVTDLLLKASLPSRRSHKLCHVKSKQLPILTCPPVIAPAFFKDVLTITKEWL